MHQEDLCRAAGRHPSDKYLADGGPSPGDIADVLRTTIPSPGAEDALSKFTDGLIFNWLIAGTDAHAKNYSLLLSGPQAVFAPLYDISSHLPYDDSKGHQLKLAMKVGGDYRLLRTDRRSTWERAARELRVDPDALLRAAELADQVADASTEAANDEAVRELTSPIPSQLIDLVADRAEVCRRALGTGSSTDTPKG